VHAWVQYTVHAWVHIQCIHGYIYSACMGTYTYYTESRFQTSIHLINGETTFATDVSYIDIVTLNHKQARTDV